MYNLNISYSILFIILLKDVEVTGDKDDSRCLHVTVHNSPTSSSFFSTSSPAHRLPQLAARFVFDDHIRCMAAKQRYTFHNLNYFQHVQFINFFSG